MKIIPLDLHAYQKAQQRAANTYHKAAVLQHEIAQRLIDHLELVRFQPQIILDLGAKTGFTTKLLRRRYPKAELIAADGVLAMLQKNQRNHGLFRKQTCVTTTAEQLPFKNQSIDMVFANLELSFTNFATSVQEINQVLKPNGVLFFSALGPDTLRELRASWKNVDNEIHTHAFIDMHDLGDELVQAGFLDPVMEMEHFTLTYSKLENLFRDLKQTGWQNVAAMRHPFLTGKNKWQAMLQNYQKFRNEDKQYPATFEIIYGHAWAREQPMQRVNESGEVTISISSLIKRI